MPTDNQCRRTYLADKNRSWKKFSDLAVQIEVAEHCSLSSILWPANNGIVKPLPNSNHWPP